MPAVCLIAEADPFIANLLLRFAEESGVRAARAKTGQEMLELVHRLSPDILIVEPELPGEQRGWEVVRALRTEAGSSSKNPAPALAAAPAVISCSWLEKAEAGKLLGPVAWHLQKPNLYYGDFVKALRAAGVATDDSSTPK